MEKGQLARIVDVVIIGPLMIYFGIQSRNVKVDLKSLMIAIGIGTILYNGQNLLADANIINIKQTNDIAYGFFTILVFIFLNKMYNYK